MFRTVFWKAFAEKHGIRMAHFDQGRMGHERTKPTTVGYAGMDLGELDGMRMLSSSVPSEWRDARDLSKKIALTKEWVAWAPGLKEALAVAMEKELPVNPMVKAMGKKMDKESWMAHVMNDHYPSRRAFGKIPCGRSVHVPSYKTRSTDHHSVEEGG